VALLYVQEIVKLSLDQLDESVTLFAVSVSGLC